MEATWLQIKACHVSERATRHVGDTHRHRDPQWYLCTSGSIQVMVNESPLVCAPGEHVLVQPWQHRSFRAQRPSTYLMVRFQSSCLHTDRWHNAVHQLPDMLGDDLQQLLDLLTSGSETAAAAVLTEVLLLRLLLSAESSALERRRSDLPSDRPNAVATLESAQRFIQRNLDQPLTREQIAAACHCSGVHLARLTQRFFKCTPLELITEARMQQARELLSRDQRSISAIAGLVGYATASHFSQVFRKKHGLSPREFRRAGGRMWWQHKPNDGGPIYHHEANAVAEGTR